MSELTTRYPLLRKIVSFAKENEESVTKIVNFFFSYAVYLAMVLFGALWSLMSYAKVDADTAMAIINHDIYSLALFTAVFLMLILAFSRVVEWIGKL